MFRKRDKHAVQPATDKDKSEAVRKQMKNDQLAKVNSNAAANGEAPITEQEHDDVMAALGMPGYGK